MRGDIPAAAFRLLASLPVHTHIRHERRKKPKAGAGVGKGGTWRKPVMVDGVEYRTLHEARAALGIGKRKMYEMLAEGSMREIDDGG